MEENQRLHNQKHNFTSYNFQKRDYLDYKFGQNLWFDSEVLFGGPRPMLYFLPKVFHLYLPSCSKYITLHFLVGEMQNCQQENKCYAK